MSAVCLDFCFLSDGGWRVERVGCSGDPMRPFVGNRLLLLGDCADLVNVQEYAVMAAIRDNDRVTLALEMVGAGGNQDSGVHKVIV